MQVCIAMYMTWAVCMCVSVGGGWSSHLVGGEADDEGAQQLQREADGDVGVLVRHDLLRHRTRLAVHQECLCMHVQSISKACI